MKNPFLHGHLKGRVYYQQPLGIVDQAAPNYLCLLQCSLYDLKQAPRAWYQRFASYLHQIGFVAPTSDCITYLLLYTNDIVFTTSSASLLQRIIERLHSKIPVADMGTLHHFLSISATRSSDCMFLSQKKYAVDLLQRVDMAEC